MKIHINHPEGTEIELYKGLPFRKEDHAVKIDTGFPDYRVFTPGIYTWRCFGNGYLDVWKIFRVGFKDITVNAFTFPAEPSPYHPCNSDRQTIYDKKLIFYPDEILSTLSETEHDFATPWFTKSDNKHVFTSHEEMLKYISSLKSEITFIGTSPVNGLSVPMIRFTSNPKNPEVWIQAGIHGNEPASMEAVLAIAGMADYFLGDINLTIVPRVNPDGAYFFTRNNGNGININRDFILQEAEETKMLTAAFDKIKPDFLIDCHECLGFRPRNGNAMYFSDVMLACGDNDEELMLQIIHRLKAKGFSAARWPKKNEGTAREYFGSRCRTIIIETAGIGFSNYNFENRVGYQVETIKAAIDSFLNGGDLEKNEIEYIYKI